ncbi:CidA/LrgA family protein [Stutzerimonas balearica]|uniref:CidA/LrgA family protein n=1 Tax=Stutzerimonas balearica TaxID=74829 RepID=UPI003F5C97DC
MKRRTDVLKGLFVLVLLQIAGTTLSSLWLPMLPGPIVGLVLLLLGLAFLGAVPESLQKAASLLLQYLPLMLMIHAAGIMTSYELLFDEFAVVIVALLTSLLVTIPVCGWLLQFLARRMGGEQP